MALAGRSAFLKITSSTSIGSTGEAATLAADGLSIQVDSTAKRHWDQNGDTPALYLNSTAVSSTAYSLNYVQGKFEFTSTQSTGTYTADIDYFTVSSVGGGREWQLNVESEAFEITEFGSSGWKQYQPNLNGATININRYWQDSEIFDRLNTDSLFLLELGINDVTGDRYEGYGYIASDQINASVDSLVDESVQMNVSGQLYYTTG